MGLTIDRVLIANSETERAIRGALEAVGVPPGEEWSASMTALSRSSAWELMLQGPTRTKSAYFDWEIVEGDGAARYRKLFQGKDEQNVQYVRNGVRKLVWSRIQFDDNPIRSHDEALGQAFEDAVWELLRHEEMRPLQVRFGVWREGVESLRFVCKVERHATPPFDGQLPWSWWSSLVRTPQELAAELDKALQARRKREAENLALRRAREARLQAAAWSGARAGRAAHRDTHRQIAV
jgi:hypothetical protein